MPQFYSVDLIELIASRPNLFCIFTLKSIAVEFISR
jgi:hypothetical protein